MKPGSLSTLFLVLLCSSLLCSCGATKYTYTGSLTEIATQGRNAIYAAKDTLDDTPLIRKLKTDIHKRYWDISGNGFLIEYNITFEQEKENHVSLRVRCNLGFIFLFIRQESPEEELLAIINKQLLNDAQK